MAALKKGRLKPEDHFRIQANYEFLSNDFDPDNGVLDALISRGIFDTHDRDHIINVEERTARGRSQRFLKLLEDAGAHAFSEFMEALRSHGQGIIADELEKTDVSAVRKEGSYEWIVANLSEEMKQKPPTDPEASRLSAALGQGWEQFFLRLKVSQVQIDQEKMSNPHSPMNAITHLLIKWRQKLASKACFITVLKTMEEVDLARQCTIDWTIVEKVALRRE